MESHSFNPNKNYLVRWCWHTPLIQVLRRQRQEDLCELEASLVYIVSSRIGTKATEKPCLEKPKKNYPEDFSRQQIQENNYTYMIWDSPLYAVNIIG